MKKTFLVAAVSVCLTGCATTSQYRASATPATPASAISQAQAADSEKSTWLWWVLGIAATGAIIANTHHGEETGSVNEGGGDTGKVCVGEICN